MSGDSLGSGAHERVVCSGLIPGHSLDLDTRMGGGPVIKRDPVVSNAFWISGTGGELYRSEIKRLAEAAGFEVVDDAE